MSSNQNMEYIFLKTKIWENVHLFYDVEGGNTLTTRLSLLTQN